MWLISWLERKKTAKKEQKTATRAQEIQVAQLSNKLNYKFGIVKSIKLVHQVNTPLNTIGNALSYMKIHHFELHFDSNNKFSSNETCLIK